MAVKKTYRALREQRVGGVLRYFGDYIPEAEGWRNVRVWIASGHIEEVWVEEDQLKEILAVQRQGEGVAEEASAEDAPPSEEEEKTEQPEESEEESEESNDGDSEDEDEESDSDSEGEPVEQADKPKKKARRLKKN